MRWREAGDGVPRRRGMVPGMEGRLKGGCRQDCLPHGLGRSCGWGRDLDRNVETAGRIACAMAGMEAGATFAVGLR